VAKSPRRPIAADSERAATGFNFGVWTCDAAALDRIIAEVGERYVGKLDRNQLVFDLLQARSKLLTFVALDSDKGARTRKELFSAIADSASNFKERLLDERGYKYAAREIAWTFPDASHFDAFLAALDRIIDAAEALKKQNSCGGWIRLARSPKEWFAVEILPQVFERNFGRQAKFSRRDPAKAEANAVDGPFIRFALSVMGEMGIPIARETLARALKDIRAGRGRRKRRPTTLSRLSGW
jgi:hypothetical protein